MRRHLHSVPLPAAPADAAALRAELEELRSAVRRLLATMKPCAARGCPNVGTHDTDPRPHMECAEHLFEGADDPLGDERAHAVHALRALLSEPPDSRPKPR